MSLSSLLAPEVLAALAAAAGPAALIWAPTGRVKRLLAHIEADEVQAGAALPVPAADATGEAPVTAEAPLREAA